MKLKPWETKSTATHAIGGKPYTASERRKIMIYQLSKEIHVHEIWHGGTYRWYIIRANYNTTLCGTDACIRADKVKK